MTDQPKPISLKDELAKMTRGAMPAAWLSEAHAEIEAWRTTMPGAERLQLVAKLDQQLGSESLELLAHDGWGSAKGFAYYRVVESGLKFHGPHHLSSQELFQPTTLADEQAFIAHLLKVLRFALGRSD